MNQELYRGRARLCRRIRHVAGLIILCALLFGCVFSRTVVPPLPNLTWTDRPLTTKQLHRLQQRNPRLTPAVCVEILARVNHKDPIHIRYDIKHRRVLRVPNDFSAYLGWSPLPLQLQRAADLPEFILVVKNIGFLGWYKNGRLCRDTYVCIGRRSKWTKAGRYHVLDKDIDHVSHSYRDAEGRPALMPFGLRIYGRVWIHGGDVTRRNCSHGCINLPLDAAQQLYAWAAPGTTVLVVDSLQALQGPW